jgi:YHS domain-containing protein
MTTSGSSQHGSRISARACSSFFPSIYHFFIYTMKTIIPVLVVVAGLIGLCPSGRLAAATPDSQPPASAKKVDYKPYPFDTSVVGGAKLDDHAVVFVQDGYEIKVSSMSEEDNYKKNPAPYLAKIKQAYASAKPYPLGTCLVCGMALDNDDITFVYLGRQFKVCGGDEDCYEVFQKDPAKYVQAWDDAAKTVQAPAK